MHCGKPSNWNKQAKSNQCKCHLLVYYVDISIKDMRPKLTCTGQVFRYISLGEKQELIQTG